MTSFQRPENALKRSEELLEARELGALGDSGRSSQVNPFSSDFSVLSSLKLVQSPHFFGSGFLATFRSF